MNYVPLIATNIIDTHFLYFTATQYPSGKAAFPLKINFQAHEGTPCHSIDASSNGIILSKTTTYPRYLPISPIVKWDPLRHHFSKERRHSTAHCARTAGTIEDLPNVISNPETRDSPTGAVPGIWVFSRTWRHSGTFRGNFIGRDTKLGSRHRCWVRLL